MSTALREAQPKPSSDRRGWSAFSQYWYVDDETDSVIEVKNHRSSPLVLVPGLSLPGGERLETTPVSLRPFESRRLSLRRELDSRRELLAEEQVAPFSARWGNGCRSGSLLGSADLSPVYPADAARDHFSAWVVIEDATEGIGLVYPFKAASSSGGARLVGLWWRPYPDVLVCYALQNSAPEDVRVEATVLNHTGEVLGTTAVDIPPLGFHLLDLTSWISQEDGNVGAVGLSCRDAGDGLLARGMVIDEKRGLSASLESHRPSDGEAGGYNGQTLLQVPTLLFGDLKVMLPSLASLLAPDTVAVRPHLLLRNQTGEALEVRAALVPANREGTGRSITLPSIPLAPREARHLDLMTVVRANCPEVEDVVAALTLGHDGTPFDIVAELINVDETGDFCLYERVVNLHGYQPPALAAISCSLEAKRRTFLVVTNVTDRPEQARLLIDYQEGEQCYEHCLTVPAGGIEIVDLASLRDSRLPDVMRSTLPSDLTFGGCFISARTPGALVAGDPTFVFGSMPDGFSCLAEAPTGGPSAGTGSLTCTVAAKRDDRKLRFKVEGRTSKPYATVELHILEGGCNPVNAHPIPFLTGRSSVSGRFTLGPVTTVGTPIPGIGRRVLLNASYRGEKSHCCATVQAASL